MVVGLIFVLAVLIATIAFGYIADELARQAQIDRMNDANWRRHE